MKVTNDTFRLACKNPYYRNNYNNPRIKDISNYDTVHFSGLTGPVEEAEKVIASNLPSIDDVIKLFNVSPQNLPSHLKPIVSSNSKVLGFIYSYSNGELRVLKKLNRDTAEDLAYLSFVKKRPNLPDECINIDMATGDFISTSNNGKLLIIYDTIRRYNGSEKNIKELQNRIKNFLGLIFKEDKQSTPNTQEIITLKSKSRQKKIRVSDFEDVKINKIVEKEYRAAMRKHL